LGLCDERVGFRRQRHGGEAWARWFQRLAPSISRRGRYNCGLQLWDSLSRSRLWPQCDLMLLDQRHLYPSGRGAHGGPWKRRSDKSSKGCYGLCESRPGLSGRRQIWQACASLGRIWRALT
jgi:hypothetical protein